MSAPLSLSVCPWFLVTSMHAADRAGRTRGALWWEGREKRGDARSQRESDQTSGVPDAPRRPNARARLTREPRRPRAMVICEVWSEWGGVERLPEG